jgi:hypothetical protein
MKKFFKNCTGILLGAVYALMIRLVFDSQTFDGLYSLFSITFIGLVPIAIGLIPLFFASNDQLKSFGFRMGSPVATIFIFFLLCFVTRIEDLVCVLVIMIPYLLGAVVAGLVAGEIIARKRRKKEVLFSIILLPFIASPIEQQFHSPENTYTVVTKVTVNAKPENIWQNIIRVQEIKDAEYDKGFFNYAGIPRPLFAELNKDTLGATRVGHFEGGLQFVEKVVCWERNKHLGLDITVVPSSIRQTVFDQHILKGKHFRFLQADYVLTELPNGQTELSLSASYELKTKINAYGAFYGDWILTDFQERLLEVIRKRCNSSQPSPANDQR